MTSKVSYAKGREAKITKRFKFSRNGNSIAFFWGAMVEIVDVPEGDVVLSHKKGSVTISAPNAEGYVYDPVFVNNSKTKVEF